MFFCSYFGIYKRNPSQHAIPNQVIQENLIEEVEHNDSRIQTEQIQYAQFKYRNVIINFECQQRMKDPADYLILFSDRKTFLKQARYLRKFHGTINFRSHQVDKQQEGQELCSAMHLTGIARELIILYQNIPLDKRIFSEQKEHIVLTLKKNIMQALSNARYQTSSNFKKHILLTTNSIYPEIFDITQQAKLFIQALTSLEDSSHTLEISIVSKNKFELSCYMTELSEQLDTDININTNHIQQKVKQDESSITSYFRCFRQKPTEKSILCKQGHQLEFENVSFQTRYKICMFCKQEGQARYKCTTCSTYACINCVPTEIQKFQCPKKHELVFSPTKNVRTNYECDDCLLKSHLVHNGVWYDQDCDLDICGYCMREKIEVGLVEKKIIQLKRLKQVYGRLLLQKYDRYFRQEILQDFGMFLNNETLQY